jgi:hypothetical protein
MSEIEPGDGWRLIDTKKDTPMKGDQACCDLGRWIDRNAWDRPFSKSIVYRRRIPAKPEAMEIEAKRGTLTFNFQFDAVWISQSRDGRAEGLRLDDSKQVRKVIAWLQQVADWREAQDAGK